MLESVARALQLDDAERAHLLHLAQAQEGSDALARPRSRSNRQRVLPKSLQWTLDVVTAGPALVTNGRQDVLGANQLARAFFSDVYDSDAQVPNMARFQFLDPAARRFYPDWDLIADMTVDVLRTEAGRNPHDKDLHDLVGELSTRSDAFRTRWGSHNVRRHGTGVKRFHHPVVGDLTLTWHGSAVDDEPGLTLPTTPPNRTRLPKRACACSPPGPPPMTASPLSIASDPASLIADVPTRSTELACPTCPGDLDHLWSHQHE